MRWVLAYFSFIFMNGHVYAYDQLCAEHLIGSKIIFAFNDGDVHEARFYKNEFDVILGEYGAYRGESFYNDMKIFCLNYSNEVLMSYDKKSPAGPYRYDAEIQFPIDIMSGETEGKIDLRWGRYYVPYPKVYLLEE